MTVFVDKEHIGHVYTGQNKDNWNKWEPDMIGKHAEQRALKKQYGLEFGDENIEQPPLQNVDSYKRKDVTPEAEGPETAAPQQTEQGDDEAATRMKALKAQVKANYKKLGLTDKEAMGAHMQQYCKVKGDEPTEAELKAYLKIMDMQIQAAEQAEDTLPE